MALTQVDQGLLNSTAQYTGFKNRLINGAMMIDQRGSASAPVTLNGNLYGVDRWGTQASQNSKATMQQSTTAPTGFSNSLLVTSSSAYSPILSSDYFWLYQTIEGFNIADLGWGSSSAQTVTISFWVRASVTGTYSARVGNGSRSYVSTYTVNAANTWEQKTITVAGDTSGTWNTTNGTGIQLQFDLGCGSTRTTSTTNAWQAGDYQKATGSVSVVGTNGATFYITGVQLEKGSTATAYDYRPYGTELALCQRYAVSTFPTGTAWGQNRGAAGCVVVSSPGVTGFGVQMPFRMPVTMRATPTTITTYNPSAANANARYFAGSSDLPVSNLPFSQNSMTGVCYTSDTTATSLGAAIGLHYSVECEL